MGKGEVGDEDAVLVDGDVPYPLFFEGGDDIGVAHLGVHAIESAVIVASRGVVVLKEGHVDEQIIEIIPKLISVIALEFG